MENALKSYIGRNVPRYTSYPTAPHFSATVGGAEYASWLAALDPNQPISLYLHVPFCRELCWYCGCNMKLAKKDAPIAQYAAILRQEIALLAQHLPGRMKISHLHWGGGTPTALTPQDLAAVMSTVGDVFDLLDDAEIAIESDPRTITPQMIAQIGMSGFTRASFGVQEFDPVVQLAINRVQPPKMVQDCVRDLRRAGVSGINFDLIYGLPHQTVDKLMKTIDLCVDMAPERIALFGYAHVPWMAKKQRLIDESALPGPDARLAQADAAAKALTAAGYVPIGLDHFARPADAMAQAAQDQTLRRNFQGYTTDQAETILGVGTTSIGRTPEGYVQNLTETRAWTRAIQMGHLPIARGLGFKGDDALRGHVIERLMCVGKVDLQAAAQRFGQGANWYHIHRPALDGLAADGLITIDGALLRITPKGAPLARVIASTFDRYLKESQSRHAAAV